ncbi:hypothetical protein QU42_19475 [Bradyrhizobium sp. UASWS1016]|nr:hypothetical protein [Rhizobium sp.]OCX29118.1 hypothetical protein QU42_19475 [Bradyrhizobium sp. UASWS1016]
MRGPEIEWLPAMVRQLLMDGLPIEQARTTAQLAAVMAFEPGRGRPPKGPRLVGRKERGKRGRRMAYVMYRRRPISLGVQLGPKEVAHKNAGAKAAFVGWVEQQCRIITQALLARDWTLKRVFDWFLKAYSAGPGDDSVKVFGRHRNHIDSLRELFDDELFIDIKASSAERYVIWRCQQDVKRQKDDGTSKKRKYMASTAARHADTLMFILDRFCEDHGFDTRKIRRPKVPKEEAIWLTWDQVWRLLRACRGKKFDRAGKLIGFHGQRARYECVERLLLLLLYGGTRDENGRNMTWGMQANKLGQKPRGHLDPDRGKLQRQGPGARISNKRRGTSPTYGSLATMSFSWKKRDLEMREALGAEAGMRYVNMVHDENGYAVSRGQLDRRLGEVCELAGLDKISTHSIKHTGVTLCSMANMPLPMVEKAFSTTIVTLLLTYRHLHHEWFDPKPFDPKNLRFLHLRKFSPQSFEQVYGIAPPD